MRDKVQYIFLILVGSFALHCTQSAVHGGDGGGDGGGIQDARADGTCCTVLPQTFKLIGEGDIAISVGAVQTPSFDVSQYRELVVALQQNYVSGGNCSLQSENMVFQEPNSAVFIPTSQFLAPGGGGARIRVDGPTARISGYVNPINGTTCTGTAHYVIAGVSLN